MANETTTFKFDTEKLKAHINKIKSFQESFKGKVNHNPFLWLKENVEPLLERLEKGEKTELLHNLILSLKEVPPTIDKDYKEPIPEKKEPIKPMGLNIPEKK